MQPGWIVENYSTCEGGASSAFEPELIPQNQLAWLRNGRIRGGKQHTRPFMRERLVLPEGLVQGVGYFSVQGGMLVMQIAGRVYRIRVGINDASFSWEEIPLDWLNSPVLPDAWMQETVGSLVIQDGQSLPIIYDGSTARRSDLAESEVPIGRMMGYGNGRLWVAINTNEVVAGDIKTRQFQSELKFTETQYFLGGGAFYFPTPITGLKFIPSSGAAGYGSLAVFGLNRTDMVRADIAFRDLWATMPGFIQPLLLSTGAIGQFAISEVNQDAYWRDGDGGIRSLRTAVADEINGPGLTPMSREVARITEFESVHRLTGCSSMYFGNRLLMTASPFINRYGKTSFRDIIALDFSPVSSMRGKSPPSYDGEWDGLLFDRLVEGKFLGTRRGFAVSTDYDGQNRLWEFVEQQESDTFYACAGTAQLFESPVPMVAEYPARVWGDAKRRKRLERCDVYLSDIEGECELEVYFRADNYQKWTLWDTVEMCANTTDPEGTTPHVWKNLLGQERPQIKTFSITGAQNDITNFALKIGFQFQIRTVLRGKCKVQQLTVYSSMVDEQQFADRDDSFDTCANNDVTGNEINYLITPGCTMPVGTSQCELDASLAPVEPGTWTLEDYPVGVDPDEVSMTSLSPTDNLSVTVPELGDYTFQLHAGTRTIDYPMEFSCEGQYSIDLTEYPSDGSALDGALSVNVYIYDGVPAMRLIRQIPYTEFGTQIDLTQDIVDGWLEGSESVVFTYETPPGPSYGPGSLFKEAVGTTYARIPTIAEYSFTGDFTFQFWQYITSTPTPQTYGRLLDNDYATGWTVDLQTSRVEFLASSTAINIISDPGSIALDQWIHYTFRRSGATMTIWLNGVMVKTSGCGTGTLSTPSFAYIGGPAETLQSYTSDWRMWNIARSDVDIAGDYQSRLVGDEAGLVAYYPIFETDSVFEDVTGNNVELLLKTNTTEGVPAPGRLCYDALTPPCFP